MRNQLYQRAPEVMQADLGDELVAFNTVTGDTFALNEVATHVWRSLAEPKSLSDLREELLAVYDVSAEQCTVELEQLIQNLMDRGLAQKVG